MTEAKHEITKDITEKDITEQSRRQFLLGLGKWSPVVAGIALGGVLIPSAAQAWGWGNRSGGGNAAWVNFGGGGGAGWGPGWNNWGGWNNGGWFNRPWNNRGWNNWGGWNNRGGGGGGRFNGPGWGGSWANRR